MIKLTSKEGDVVMTPFSGAGSECVAAKMCGRKFIGFEINKEYCDIAHERLKHIEENEDSLGQISMMSMINN
jgi:DNA modification methylase